MVFYEEHDMTSEEEKLAGRLAHDFFRVIGRRYSGRSEMPKSWHQEFKRLLKSRGQKDLEDVLAWYCEHHKDEFVPKANTAEKFRVRFTDIRKAMATQDIIVNPNLKDTEYTTALAKSMRNRYTLPASVDAMLEVIINNSLENWKRFCKILNKFKDATERELNFLGHVIAGGIVFPENWVDFQCERVGRFQTYSGRMDLLYFTSDHPMFLQHFWREWSGKWCGRAVQFDELLHKLNMKGKGG